MPIRIEVRNQLDSPSDAHVRGAHALGVTALSSCIPMQIYNLSCELSDDDVERICHLLLADPVIDFARWSRTTAPQDNGAGKRRSTPSSKAPADDNRHHPVVADQTDSVPPRTTPDYTVEVAYRPGVTDMEARELERGIRDLGLPECHVTTAICYELQGVLSESDVHLLARQLFCNETIQHYSLAPIPPTFGMTAQASARVEHVAIRGLTDAQLQQLSRERLLSLNRHEMRAIQEYYVEVDRDPTDVELETLAQTWSEHCVHKTFKATIEYVEQDEAGHTIVQQTIDGLLRTYIQAATEHVKPPWLHSAFVDNAGIIAFDGDYDLAFKVETHNHPSALEPFGGANTGIGGVVRDIIGVSARPIATTDVLCFGPQDFPRRQLPEGLLHPARIAAGVVAGIADYGNKLGLPTANGAVLYDDGYLGNPLVFCGCVGLLPTGSHPTQPRIADRIVVLGGRTGRDGLHGATFSSAELSQETIETTGSAVQIGDPITEKGVLELVQALRDEALYTAITDCGAGGLSSAIGEMASNLGADVELREVKLKYPGLTPWEIWLSEAQERMVIAVPPQHMERLRELADLWDVEFSDLGAFTGDGELRVRYADDVVAELSMHFLHDGLPGRRMQATWTAPDPYEQAPQPITENAQDTLLRMLAHPSVASKETIVRQYDHEVRGGTIVRPYGGPKLDGANDAAVLKPLRTWHHNHGFALSVGINPNIGRVDPYAMAVAAIDEAFRNLVAVGADPTRVALLDNFCWGNPTLPDRLGTLVRACQGCFDAAVQYNAPFISGKDSLYNEYEGRPIPGTLLISAIGFVDDINQCITAHLKKAGNSIFLLGATRAELGGSLFHHIHERAGGTPPSAVENALARYQKLHSAIRQGWIHACHDLSEGGLGVALAEMAIGGRLGFLGSIASEELSVQELLFSESNGRFLIEVESGIVEMVQEHFADEPLLYIGQVTEEPSFVLEVTAPNDQGAHMNLPVDELVAAWKSSVQ